MADTAYYLGLGAAALMATVDPQAVVFAGGMVAAGEPFLAQIRANVHEYALSYPAEKVRICYATLGSDAGFIGAAACAKALADEA